MYLALIVQDSLPYGKEFQLCFLPCCSL
jgi:hypothetical protein